jgi:hypothetical protein
MGLNAILNSYGRWLLYPIVAGFIVLGGIAVYPYLAPPNRKTKCNEEYVALVAQGKPIEANLGEECKQLPDFQKILGQGANKTP